MIEINLLPEDKRQKMKLAAAAGAPAATASENLKKLVYVVPGVIGALVLVHCYLAISQITASTTLGGLKKKQQELRPQMQQLAGLKTQFESASQDEKVAQDMTKKTVSWAKKMNRLSLDLQPGVWVSDLAVNSRQMVIKCSVVSLETDPVEVINRFISALKNDPEFFSDFNSFDLGSVQKHMVGSYEITDFALTMEVKAR